jgi:hypothetical protein
MPDSLKKFDELCRVIKSKDGGFLETLEVKEYHFDSETHQVTEVVFKEFENRAHPSKNRRKELKRKVLKAEDIPPEVRQKIQELGIKIK